MKLNRYKALLIWCFVFFISVSNANSQSIRVLSCDEKTPIGEAYLIKDNILLGGISNSEGKLSYPEKWENTKVSLQKFGYHNKPISVVNNSEFCMVKKSFELNEVEINSDRISLEEQLKSFVIKSSIQMSKKKLDTSYFHFEYIVSVPDSNWKEVRTGVLMLITSGYNKKNSKIWLSKYCKLYTEVDSVFWHTPIRKDMVGGTLIGVQRYEGIRKGAMLHSAIEKDAILQKRVFETEIEFEIKSDTSKNENRSLIHIVFTKDSLIKSFDYQWLRKEDELRWGVKKHKNNSTYIKWVYGVTDLPINFESIEASIGFISEDGLNYIHKMQMNKIENFDSSDNCLDETSIFLKFAPEVFNLMNMNVYYRK